GRPVGAAGKDASAPQVPLIEHADVRRMLLAQKAYVEGGLGLNLYCARLVDQARVAESSDARAQCVRLLDILTPIAKSWPAQWCLAANDLAIQVHGGYGYTREYKVEQFYRDNRLNPIHEGAHGIQGLDLLGRKVVMDGGAAFMAFAARVQATIARAMASSDAALQDHATALQSRLRRLSEVTRSLWSAGDPQLTLANASVYLEAFGHVTVAWIWLEQALAADGKDSDFHDGKRSAARFFFHWELPKVDPQLELLASLERTPLDMRDAWF
ncbi:MAG: acyl-CoA dehydrogenase, partial [Pseudomonadota bacterium]|nr:acyl-CoA dehydrogenase [Pseudomonadota bacterium]